MLRTFACCLIGFGLATLSGASGCSSNDDSCEKSEDCSSHVCNVAKETCEASSCTDGVKNGKETDLDCGGSCAKCDDQKTCKASRDCVSGVCKGNVCQAPTNTDGVKNGKETDADCGGAGNPPCRDGKACAAGSDCTSEHCNASVCAPVSPADGVQNGDETDVDCGGLAAPHCADNLKCLVDADCKSDICKDSGAGLHCKPPTPTDGKRNGTETDVDCGGDAAPACAIGKMCLVKTDCASLGCDYNSKCVAFRSCSAHFGGDTCGLGGAGGTGPAQWESCCTTAPVTPSAGPTANVAVQLGKYQVTAGRMRAFMTDVNYDVRGFVQQARTAGKIPTIPGNAAGKLVLDPGWDMYLPTSFAGNELSTELADCSQTDTTTPTGTDCKPDTLQPGVYTAVSRHLGGFIFKGNAQTATGCFVDSPGTHAFRFPDGQQDGDPPQLSQDDYDTKAMNCVDYLVAQAFCVWDGGRLELLDEWKAAFGPGIYPYSATDSRAPVAPGSDTYWGCRFPWATDAMQDTCGTPWDAATKSIELIDYKYSYEYPKLLGSDYIVFISAPGRTRGRGPGGHADVIGNNFELTSTVVWAAGPWDANHAWTGNGSWEVHDFNKGGGPTTILLNKYGKLGLRCAYP